MRHEIDKFLIKCVRASLRDQATDYNKYSIKDCADNEYLDPNYDPFKLLEFTLMSYTIREKYGFTEKAKT